MSCRSKSFGRVLRQARTWIVFNTCLAVSLPLQKNFWLNNFQTPDFFSANYSTSSLTPIQCDCFCLCGFKWQDFVIWFNFLKFLNLHSVAIEICCSPTSGFFMCGVFSLNIPSLHVVTSSRMYRYSLICFSGVKYFYSSVSFDSWRCRSSREHLLTHTLK